MRVWSVVGEVVMWRGKGGVVVVSRRQCVLVGGKWRTRVPAPLLQSSVAKATACPGVGSLVVENVRYSSSFQASPQTAASMARILATLGVAAAVVSLGAAASFCDEAGSWVRGARMKTQPRVVATSGTPERQNSGGSRSGSDDWASTLLRVSPLPSSGASRRHASCVNLSNAVCLLCPDTV